MENLSLFINNFLIIYFSLGILAGLILVIDKYFMIRRYPLLSNSCMYDILLKDDERKIRLGTISKRKARMILDTKYKLENKVNTNEYLYSYFKNGKVKDYSEILGYILDDSSYDVKSKKILDRFRKMKDIASKEFSFKKSDFEYVESVSAYEYANVGYVIKLALRAKYINEKTAIRYLRILKKYVDSEFEDWLDYGVSFLTGRCIKSSQNDEELIYILDYLIFDNRSFWSKIEFGLENDDFLTRFEY